MSRSGRNALHCLIAAPALAAALLAVGCGLTDNSDAAAAGKTDRSDANAGPGKSPRTKSDRPVGSPAQAAPAGLSIGVTLAAFTLPAGSIDEHDPLWAKVDESRLGLARRTLLQYNGLRAGVVSAADRDAVAKLLAGRALNRIGHGERPIADRTPLALGLRRVQDPRAALFLHALDGTMSARQYHSPASGLMVTPAVESGEPDWVYVDGLPVVDFRHEIEIGSVVAGREPIRDLTLKELLEMLPAAGRPVAAGAGPGAGREELSGFRFRAKVPSGGALLIAPRKSAVDELNLGRMLLVEGPKDVGVETVLFIGVRVINGRLGE